MSEFINESPIEWSEIEKGVQNHFRTTATFGKHKTAKKVSDGTGFVTDVVLITADWEGSGDDEHLPETFVIKICVLPSRREKKKDANALEEMMTDNNTQLMSENNEEANARDKYTAKLHHTEGSLLDILKKNKIDGIRMPEMYCWSEADLSKGVGYIVMEYISGNPKQQMADNLPEHAITQCLESMAALQSSIRVMTEEEKKPFTSTKLFGDIFGVLMTPNMREQFAKTMRSFGSNISSQVEEFIVGYEEMSAPSYMEFNDLTAENLGMEKVLIHGDVWICNMLWNISQDDQWTLKGLIDLQTAQLGCSSCDLIRLMVGCMSGSDRRKQWQSITERFHQMLTKHYEGEAPFTLEQLKEGYRRMFPLCGLIVCTCISALNQMIISSKPEETREKYRAALVEKFECLVQDINTYHKRNKKIMAGENPDAEIVID